MGDKAAAPRDKYDQWVFDTFGVDPSTYPASRAKPGDGGAAPSAAGAHAAEDPHNVASMDKTTLVAGQGKNPAVADAGGGGVELAAYRPPSGAAGGRAGGSSLDPVNKGLDTADKALDVLDKFLENIRVDISGSVSFFQDVDIVTTFGNPTNAGTERDPVASLPIDITCSLKSLTITRGQKVFSGTLSGASGYKTIAQA